MIASVGEYVYSTADAADGVYVHLYVQGEGRLQVGDQEVVIQQETDHPWGEQVRIRMRLEHPATFRLNLRVPDWCPDARATIATTGSAPASGRRKGYLFFEAEWTGEETITLTLPMPVVRMAAHPSVRADEGLVALQRGPVVYCLEATDNEAPLGRIILPRTAEFGAIRNDKLLGGVCVLAADALAELDEGWEDALYRPAGAGLKPVAATWVPYCVWDNREPGEMRVWVRQV